MINFKMLKSGLATMFDGLAEVYNTSLILGEPSKLIIEVVHLRNTKIARIEANILDMDDILSEDILSRVSDERDSISTHLNTKSNVILKSFVVGV